MTEITKNLTFAITHGRTATTFVTKLFTLFEDTRSEHEPNPNFASYLPKVKIDPRHAVKFLEEKVKSIQSLKEKNYVETSNVFCKGYFIPFLRSYNVFPNLLLLNRDFRKVASSLHKRGSIPERSKNGKLFSCETSQPGTLPMFGSHTLSDYQMCYWTTLDAYARQLQAVEIYKAEKKKNFVWCTPEDFHEFDFLKATGHKFGLKFANEAAAKLKHEEYAGTKFNMNPDRKTEEISDIDKEEAVVLDRIAYYDPVFVEQALKSDFQHPNVKKLLKS